MRVSPPSGLRGAAAPLSPAQGICGCRLVSDTSRFPFVPLAMPELWSLAWPPMNQAGTSLRSPGAILHDIRVLLAPDEERILTQKQLAKLLGYTVQYVQRIESGKTRMQRHHVRRLAEIKVPAAHADTFARLLAELRAAVAMQWDDTEAPPGTVPASPEMPMPSAPPPTGEAPLGALGDKVDRDCDVVGRVEADRAGRGHRRAPKGPS